MHFFRVFDRDRDGFLMVGELKQFLTTLGDRMSDQEVEHMIKLIFKENEELVECEGDLYLPYS